MRQAWQEYERLLAAKGTQLTPLGLGEVALEREDALLAISLLTDASRPVLGGDVYFQADSVIEPAYANWYVDRKDAETRDTYLSRSWEVASRYIKDFPRRTDVKVLFTLVIGE